jgi:YHS domain-containing protein
LEAKRCQRTRTAVAPVEVLDPVCGMTIPPDDAIGHVDHKDTTYYFCSESRALMDPRPTRTVRAAAGRYTRIVSWKRQVTIVVLVLFTLLPVSGTLCAMVCDAAAATASTHHGSGRTCEEAAPPSTGVQIEGVTDHDCVNHDAAVRRIASTAPKRVDLQAAAIVFALSAGHASFRSLPLNAPAFDDTSPPGTAPRTTTPLVLRV